MVPSTLAVNKGSVQWDEAVKVAETYLQDLKTVRARFVQTNYDGGQLVGTFYLERPGYLRFDYDPPIEDFIVADGVFIYFYDAELGEATNSPIGLTLADFLLRKDINFHHDDLKVIAVKRAGGGVQIQLAQSDDIEAGSLILVFDEAQTMLKKWRVIDGQGLITEVALSEVQTDIQHPSGLFTYHKPKASEMRYND